VGVLPLVVAGDAAPEVGNARERLGIAVNEALAHASYDTVLLNADQAGDSERPYCADPVCWQRLASEHEVTHFLVVVVHFTDPDYRIQARLVDGRNGEPAGSRELSCDLCGLTELAERVRDVAATIRREVEATMVPAPTLAITSAPNGASVLVDGEPVGVTPLELVSVAGAHRVEIVHNGYVTHSMDVDLVDGVRREISASLRPVPVAVVEQAPWDRRSKALIGGGTAVAVAGLGAVIGGLVLIGIDDQPINGDCSGDNVDEEGRCRFLHDTRPAGIGVTAGGAVLLGAGVALAVVGVRRHRTQRGGVQPVAWRHGIGIAGRF